MNRITVLLLLLTVPTALADTVIIGAGRTRPFPIPLSYGQVTYLYARLDKPIPNVTASGSTLPTTLGGISVWVGFRTPVLKMPLFSVEPASSCSIPNSNIYDACDSPPVAAIRVQVPYELLTKGFFQPETAWGQIWIEVDGRRSDPIVFDLLPYNPEILTQCGPKAPRSCSTTELWRADGTPMARQKARPGEVLSLYAYGLGMIRPTPASGEPAPLRTDWTFDWAPIVRDIFLDFRPNARVGQSPTGAVVMIRPDFAGLVPGFVGLYQVNFTVPEPPHPLESCTDYESNVTVRIAGQSIPFCIETPNDQRWTP
ncbi:MAG: hypothetical protein IT168_19930 [Bryobacterales bacterium]|nr:hypothetical protein [Bryobacterales bacterium]